jgi:hypothetical protein
MSDHDYQRAVIGMGEILTGVVNACRGEPPEDCSWSTHDAAELAGKAAAVANAALAVYGPDSGDAESEAFVRALYDWRLVVEDTIRQRAELDELRENQGRLEP